MDASQLGSIIEGAQHAKTVVDNTSALTLTVDEYLLLFNAAFRASMLPLELIVGSGLTVITVVTGVVGKFIHSKLEQLTEQNKEHWEALSRLERRVDAHLEESITANNEIRSRLR
jgi:hypothetical protein